MSGDQSEFVSKLSGYAVLGSEQAPLTLGGDLTRVALESILAQADAKAAIARAVTRDDVTTVALPGHDEHRHRPARS
jgi:hypothetical protein